MIEDPMLVATFLRDIEDYHLAMTAFVAADRAGEPKELIEALRKWRARKQARLGMILGYIAANQLEEREKKSISRRKRAGG